VPGLLGAFSANARHYASGTADRDRISLSADAAPVNALSADAVPVNALSADVVPAGRGVGGREIMAAWPRTAR